jgi:transcriptional regulator with XRE-family HTH domain
MIIRKLRLEQGWTQQELAQHSGLSTELYNGLKKGSYQAKKVQSV